MLELEVYLFLLHISGILFFNDLSAITVGSDIDIRVLKGYGIGYTKKYTYNYKENKYDCDDETFNRGDVDYSDKSSNIFTNFSNYNLAFPQIVRSDINNHNFRFCEFFDAIICDPPYGQRAFTRKSGLETKKKEKRDKRLKEKYSDFIENKKFLKDNKEEKNNLNNDKDNNSDENNSEHEVIDEELDKEISEKVYIDDEKYKFSPLKHHSVEQIFLDLMDISNKCIKKGGFMVCLYPVYKKKEELL